MNHIITDRQRDAFNDLQEAIAELHTERNAAGVSAFDILRQKAQEGALDDLVLTLDIITED